MIKFLKKHSWAMYLGAVLSYVGINPTDLFFWIVFIPTTILINLSQEQ